MGSLEGLGRIVMGSGKGLVGRGEQVRIVISLGKWGMKREDSGLGK